MASGYYNLGDFVHITRCHKVIIKQPWIIIIDRPGHLSCNARNLTIYAGFSCLLPVILHRPGGAKRRHRWRPGLGAIELFAVSMYPDNMPFKPLRSFIAALVLLAFTGQALAALATACSGMQAGSPPHSGPMTDMGHAAHIMPDGPDSSEASASPADCCADAFCAMNHCLGAPAFGVATGFRFHASGAGILNTLYLLSYRPPAARSLFRPPITR